ncbi:MAG: hypothetical protein IK016_10000 [Lachnospiraceae bacterium]|nr:hypothetical protein [Lachnospiraceae bacterium]
MTLQQEAYRRIDRMSDNAIRLFLDMADRMQFMTVSDFDKGKKETDEMPMTSDIVDTIDVECLELMSKEEKKALFLRSRGNMRIDSEAIASMRERSMI